MVPKWLSNSQATSIYGVLKFAISKKFILKKSTIFKRLRAERVKVCQSEKIENKLLVDL